MKKFNDDFHENTEDGFVLERGYKSIRLVRIYQEFDSGLIREFLLTPEDIKQITKELDKNDGKTN